MDKRRFYIFIGVLILCLLLSITIYFVTPEEIMNLINGINRKNNSNDAMDTTEASWNANSTINVDWFDLTCPSSIDVAPITEIYENIARSNAILMRSNASFKLALGNRVSIPSASCILSINDFQRSAFISSEVKKNTKNTMSALAIVVVTIDNNPISSTRTKGFATVGSKMVFLDRGELSVPTYTLMHEAGHAWGLPHPFDSDRPFDEELPLVCATSLTRVRQVENCPTDLRTCGGKNEMLNNVMDYLPERCGQKYYFTKNQIATIDVAARTTIVEKENNDIETS